MTFKLDHLLEKEDKCYHAFTGTGQDNSFSVSLHQLTFTPLPTVAATTDIFSFQRREDMTSSLDKITWLVIVPSILECI